MFKFYLLDLDLPSFKSKSSNLEIRCTIYVKITM